MLLSYTTSSLTYDNLDLVYGKFFPAKNDVVHSNEIASPIRIFCNVYGMFANLTGRFAERFDNYKIPTIDNKDEIVDSQLMLNTIPRSAVRAIMEEDNFWKGMQPYPWYMLLMREVYNLCGGEYYLLISFYDSLQLDDRIIWVWRHFGNVARSHSLVLSYGVAPLLIKSRNDILISGDLTHIEKWCNHGGSGFWWPEIYSNCADPAKLLSKRIRLLHNAANDLKSLNKNKL